MNLKRFSQQQQQQHQQRHWRWPALKAEPPPACGSSEAPFVSAGRKRLASAFPGAEANRKWPATRWKQVASGGLVAPGGRLSAFSSVGAITLVAALVLVSQAATCHQLYSMDNNNNNNIPYSIKSDQHLYHQPAEDHNHHRDHHHHQQQQPQQLRPSTGSVKVTESENSININNNNNSATSLQLHRPTISDGDGDGDGDRVMGPQLVSTAAAVPASSSAQANGSENMKLPLYMRILATLACLIIFTIGVCGNLLVPLVVIKTKYLRNSTNLFLINLSVADLLVLIVCMPTVLIELHSRPETWLLGEPMCKLSNFVEMLAANGSIFTILAISFERYYAICKPLKAGYKCTRLRATIIICLIWILSTILTSPILIMAKSSETIYIDGSLVYNCILETDTYWHKMYVFVSMIAFFCLPLIVLMLVYWLIGRRLIRENLAMSTTTSLATNDSTIQEPSSSTCDSNGGGGAAAAGSGSGCGNHFGAEQCTHHNHHRTSSQLHGCPHHSHSHHSPASSAIYVVRKRVGGSLKKASSLKSISASLFSLLQQQQNYHQTSLKHSRTQETTRNTEATTTNTPITMTEPSDGDQPAGGCGGHPVCGGSIRATAKRLAGANDKTETSLANHHHHHHLATNRCQVDGNESLQSAGGTSTGSPNSHETNLANLVGVGTGTGTDATYQTAYDGHQDAYGAGGCGNVNGSGNDLMMANGETTGGGRQQARVARKPIRRSLANQFVYHLFHIKSIKPNHGDNLLGPAKQTQDVLQDKLNKRQSYFDGDGNQLNGPIVLAPQNNGINEMHATSAEARQNGSCAGGYPPAAGSDQDELRTPFIARGLFKFQGNGCGGGGGGSHGGQSNEPPSSCQTNDQLKRQILSSSSSTKKAPSPSSRFYWPKRFSVSSSSASMQTNCTNLPSSDVSSSGEVSNLPFTTADATGSGSGAQISPRPIIHHGSVGAAGNIPRLDNGADSSQRARLQQQQQQTFASGAKKSAHFSIDTRDNSSPPTTCSSASESSSTNTYSMKTPSPTIEGSLFDDSQLPGGPTNQPQRQVNGAADSGGRISRRSSGTSSSASSHSGGGSRGSKTPSPHQYPSLQTTKNSSTVEEEPEPEEEEEEGQQQLNLDDIESAPRGAGCSIERESRALLVGGPNYLGRAAATTNYDSPIENCGNNQVVKDPDESHRHVVVLVSATNKTPPDPSEGPLKEAEEEPKSFTAAIGKHNNPDNGHGGSRRAKAKVPIRKGISLDHKSRDSSHHNHNHHHHTFHFNLKRANTRCGTQSTICGHHHYNNSSNQANGSQHLSELLVVQDISKKQQMDSRRQVVVMLAFVVACFFLLFFPYRVFTIWLILSTEDQVQSLGMETYYNLTYFSRILIYLHSAINPIAYNLISTKFRRAFMSILLCRGSSTRRHFITEHHHRINNHNTNKLLHNTNGHHLHSNNNGTHNNSKKQQLKHLQSS